MNSESQGALIRTAVADLRDDLRALARLLSNRISLMVDLVEDLAHRSDVASDSVGDEIRSDIGRLMAADRVSLEDIRRQLEGAQSEPAELELVYLLATRRQVCEQVRARQSVAAGLVAAADWHSPSISHSVTATAGRQVGRVVARHDDYRRDRHPDQLAWERRWQSEMVDNPGGHKLRALMFASGMAAFTTIVALLEEEVGPGPVLIGASIYHECRIQLQHSRLASRIVSIPEGDRDRWRAAVDAGPAAIMVDTVANAPGMDVIDLNSLMRRLRESGASAWLVVDNTALSVSCQPWTMVDPASAAQMIVFESLTKYPQLGLDRAAGGVVVTRAQTARSLDSMREHLGTNVADVVTHQHLPPDRSLLRARLERIGRNAGVVAGQLQKRIDTKMLACQIAYPGLSSHPGYGSMKEAWFKGGLLAIRPFAPDTTVPFSRQFIKTALYLATDRSVPLCEGASFGFDFSRLYLTAATAEVATPFLRVAVGAENRLGIEQVASVLADALEATI